MSRSIIAGGLVAVKKAATLYISILLSYTTRLMSQKTAQVAELIRHELAAIMARELELPAGALVTITQVEISPDLENAVIWVTVTPEAQAGVVYGLLRDKRTELRHLLTEQVKLRVAPKLRFRMDKAGGLVVEVERLLQEIHGEKK